MTFKNSEFSSDQTFLTSEESRKLYELFKEIIIAWKFAENDFNVNQD